MVELKVLQAVRLKGRVSSADLAEAVDDEPASVAAAVDELTAAGLLIAAKALKISPAGRDRLTELLAAERESADPVAVEEAYGDFRAVNADFKALMTDWQLRDGHPNAHDDAAYDAAVIGRLHAVHTGVLPIIEAVAEQLPRLSAYGDKLTTALGRIDGGDVSWLARPIVDSYHTVWFELHEELILATGLSRHDEAQAGHAG